MLRINSACADDLARVHPWLVARAGHIPGAALYGMQVALEEAVMNVAMHGFHPGASGEIAISLSVSPDAAVLVVEDTGCAFDPTVAPSPARPVVIQDIEPGGLGLTLLRHYCSDMSYERVEAKNRLTLRFPLTPE